RLSVDQSITEDIGYMWNRALHGDSGLEYHDIFWVGLRNLVWQSPGNIQPNYATWLYNDAAGNIILEITETYFWHHSEPTMGINYISYEEFMQDYKPFIVRTIPRKTAQNWLHQAESVLGILKKNEERAVGKNR